MGRQYYSPVTYQRDETKEFTRIDEKKLIEILKKEPIDEMWTPKNIGWCTVQRVWAHNMPHPVYLCGDHRKYDPNHPDDYLAYGVNGDLYLQIGRMPNTNWMEESGRTYMCWK